MFCIMIDIEKKDVVVSYEMRAQNNAMLCYDMTCSDWKIKMDGEK